MRRKDNRPELCRGCFVKAVDLQIRDLIDLQINPPKFGSYHRVAFFLFYKKGQVMKTIVIN